VVDSIVTGKYKPGTCLTFTIKDFEHLLQLNPVNSHSLNLPTTIKTGQKCGYTMPEELIVLCIESADVTTLSEQLTDSVNACVDDVVKRIRKEILLWIELDSIVH
jgi:hydrogenase maturation protease